MAKNCKRRHEACHTIQSTLLPQHQPLLILASRAEETRTFIVAATLVACVVGLMLVTVYKTPNHSTAGLNIAVTNMTQGLLLLQDFTFQSRIAFCNGRYLEMFGLSADVAKPGCTFRELMQHRKELGTLSGDVDEYCAKIRNSITIRPDHAGRNSRMVAAFKLHLDRQRAADGFLLLRMSRSIGSAARSEPHAWPCTTR